MNVRSYMVAAGLLVAACGKEPERRAPDLTPDKPVPLEAVSGSKALESVSAPREYGPAVFHPQTCPKPTAPQKMPYDGCDKCQKDEYCVAEHVRGRTFGRCAKNSCQKDADCKGSMCWCGPPNKCVTGNCRSAEDCGGRECAPDRWRYGHGSGQFCRTKDDACKTHEECGLDQECAFLGEKWGCRKATPAPPPG